MPRVKDVLVAGLRSLLGSVLRGYKTPVYLHLSAHLWSVWTSRAIAKMTARCALLPGYNHGYFSRNNVSGLLLRQMVLKCVQKLKFVALPVPEIIGGT